ncbi:hypothetical protein BBF96_14195 [Anoxybacter fermentans]|uniref:Fibronectin type-III domain-containing protein n=1 Tax=Anoxybacter fermentans TaxID=1323375 RepID=A0A3Q9HSS5_9FIRM|nr:M6 family metalloprotease domain-containing protein [Anoxybacter fermentans]AZR74435.1 hypothetical protein BBF96_14195 [Anoxybacter fermentans]
MKKIYLSLFIVTTLLILFTVTAFAVPPKPGVHEPVDEKGIPYYLYLDQPRDISKLLAEQGGWYGVAKVLVIMMEFANMTFPEDKDQAYWEEMLAGENNPYSMVKYYEHISYGHFSLEIGFSPVVKVSKDIEYYGEDEGTNHNPRIKEAIDEALDILAEQNFDFSPYDADNDGNLDHVIFIQAGPGQEGGAPSWAIWSHRSSHRYAIPGTNYSLDGYTIQPVDGNVGVFCHEFGHDLGLPDLYDRDYSSSGVGRWALMAGGSWNGTPSGTMPAEMIAFHRMQLGWLTPTVVTTDMTGVEIPNLEDNPFALKVWTEGKALNEYFLIENRQPVGFDEALPGDGLLIWHINEANSTIQNDREFNYLAAIEQADGRYDLEFNVNRGDAGDPYPGSTNNREFSVNTEPNSRSLDGIDTFVAVKNISDSAMVMTVDVQVTPARITDVPEIVEPISVLDTNIVDFEWKPVTGATTYVFELAADKDFTNIIYSGELYINNLILSLDFDTTYYWRVKAKNNNGEGPWSSVASFTTPDKANILVLIDDGGGFGIEPYYTSTLKDLGVHYNVVDLWDAYYVDVLDKVLSQDILDYDIVIYAGDWGLLYDSVVQDYLITAMDNGVNLFITAQDTGWAAGAGIINQAFYEGKLHSKFVQDNIGLWTLEGAPGTVFAGMTITIAGGSGANNQDYPDEIDPIYPAIPLFTYTEGSQSQEIIKSSSSRFINEILPLKESEIGLMEALSSGTGAVFYDSSQDPNYNGTAHFRVVNFAFGFEAISTAEDRATVMRKVLNLLLGEDNAAPVVSLQSGPEFTVENGLNAVYSLDEPATITVEVYTADNAPQVLNGMKLLADAAPVATIVSNVGYPAGNITINWDGIDDKGNMIPGGSYVLAIQATDIAGNATGAIVNEFTVTGTADILTVNLDQSVLTPNDDNVNDTLTISGTLTENATVTVDVIDMISGEVVSTIYNQNISAGEFSYTWDGTIGEDKINDGKYKVSVTANGQSGMDCYETELLIDAFTPEFLVLYASSFIAPASNEDWTVNISGNTDVAKIVIQASEPVNLTIDIYQENDGKEQIYDTISSTIGTSCVVASWDAKDSEGNFVEDGLYKIRITLEDFAGNKIVNDNLSIEVDSTPVALINPTVTPSTIIRDATDTDTVTLRFRTEEDIETAYLTVRYYIPEWHWYTGLLETLEGDSEPMAAGDHELTFQWKDGEEILPVGDYCFRLRLYDEHTTNKIYLFPFQIVEYETVTSKGGDYAVDYVTISIPEEAVAADTKIAFYRNIEIWGMDYDNVAGAYSNYLIPTKGSIIIDSKDPDLKFAKPVTLTFTYDDTMLDTNFDGVVDENLADNPNLIIYKWDGINWIPLDTTVNKEAQTLTAKITEPGSYAVMANVEINDNFEVGREKVKVGFSNNPFSPNGDGFKDTTAFKFLLPFTAKVTVKIYDHNGNLATTLIDGVTYGSGINWVEWDGSNDAKQILPSGMYIYKYTIEHSDGTIEGKGVIGILK